MTDTLTSNPVQNHPVPGDRVLGDRVQSHPAVPYRGLEPLGIPPQFPDHTQLPESDGTFVKNFQEHPQSLLLTDAIVPTLNRMHPDGNYAIGQDCGIYWRETEPPEKGAEASDWFYVPNVPPRLDGVIRRSYVIWREFIAPTHVLEFASGDGHEECDRTPLGDRHAVETQRPGKFWVYERIMRIPFYGIFLIQSGELEVYQLSEGYYQPVVANERGHYPIPPMGVALGVWLGSYNSTDQMQPWLRWWDLQGNLRLTGREQAALSEQRADSAEQRADSAEQKAARLAAKLRELNIDPEAL